MQLPRKNSHTVLSLTVRERGGCNPAVEKPRPARNRWAGGRLAAAPEKIGCSALPLLGPLTVLPASYPAAGCAADAVLHDTPAEPQLSTPPQMSDMLVRLEEPTFRCWCYRRDIDCELVSGVDVDLTIAV